ENNPQLQRVYGTAFKTKKELDDYFAMLEEAKKRDHRKLGRELELFVFDDDVGPGVPMFLPRGAVIAEELEKLAKETEFAAGYQRVRTPHIARESLYKKSGHLPYYAESMFAPMTLRAETKKKRFLKRADANWDKLLAFAKKKFKVVEPPQGVDHDEALERDLWSILTEESEAGNLPPDIAKLWAEAQKLVEQEEEDREEGQLYYLKAMNCPHHHKLFAAIPRSYRDL